MQQSVSFADVLEAIDQLPDEDQTALIEIVRRRRSRRGRERVVAEAQEAQREFEAGR